MVIGTFSALQDTFYVLEETWSLLIGSLYPLSGSYGNYLSIFADNIQDACKLSKVFHGSPKNFIPSLLPLLLCDTKNISHECGSALGIRKLVGIDISNCSNYSLVELVLGKLQVLQEVNSSYRKGKSWSYSYRLESYVYEIKYELHQLILCHKHNSPSYTSTVDSRLGSL